MTGMGEKGCALTSLHLLLKKGQVPLPLSQEQQARGADALSRPWVLTEVPGIGCHPQEHTSVLRDGWGLLHLPLQCVEKRQGITN